MKICITVDLDNYQDYQSLIDPETGSTARSFYLDAVPRYLDLFDRFGIRATFFMIGRDAAPAANRKVVREIADRGHEVGNHSYSHPYNFRQLSRTEKEAEIDQADAAISDILGERPVGFRTPSCDVDSETLSLLAERGYLYDSSVFPTPLMWIFMLYGKLFVRRAHYQLGQLATALAPAVPYSPSSRRIHRRRKEGDEEAPQVLEIPFSVVPVLRLPFYSTLLRRFGARFFSVMTRAYGKRHPVLHALFHLIELADFEDTSLGRAFERTPGLAVSFSVRRRFVSHALETLASAGEAVPLRELARYYVSNPKGGTSE